MGKIPTKRPMGIKTPVKLSDDKYEMWYLKPVYLGVIEKDGPNWFTEDEMRFRTSMDALDYLIKMRETLVAEFDKQIEQNYRERMNIKDSVEGSNEFVSSYAYRTSSSPAPAPIQKIAKSSGKSAQIHMNDPATQELFKQFMAFQSQQSIAQSKGRSRKK